MASLDCAIGNPLAPPDTRLAEIARRQHGLVRTQDLRAAGVSASAASRRRARGMLHRVHPGVDAVGHAALSREAECLAAVFAAGEGAALDLRAAADLWRIRRGRPAAITVVAPRRVRIAGVRVHHCKRLDPRDVTVRNGIPVTTVARTIVDLAEIETVERLTNVMYEAAYLGLLDLDEVRACAARLNGRKRLAVLEEAIEAAPQGQCREQEREGGRVPCARPRQVAEADREREGARRGGRRVLAGVQAGRRDRRARARPSTGATAGPAHRSNAPSRRLHGPALLGQARSSSGPRRSSRPFRRR